MKIKLMALLAVGLLVGPMTVQAAPGGVTDGLRVWLRADTGISVNDGEAVEVWADQSGEGNDAVFNPANVFGENPPVLDASNPGVAGRPTVRFNNVNALELDLGFLVGSDYTIFVVNGRDRTGVANFYIAGDSGGANTNLVLGYETVAQLRQSHFLSDLNAVVPEYGGTELWQMDTFVFDQTVGRSIYQDGALRASDSNVVPLTDNTGTTLGHFRAFGNLYWFQGDLAEVIIYDRALSRAEQRAVEAELGVLYGRPFGLFDTGPGENFFGGTIVDQNQSLAGLFTLDTDTSISSIEGWMVSLFDVDYTIAVHAVMGAGPGAVIFSDTFTAVGFDSGGDLPMWQGLVGINLDLAAGSYWVSFSTSDTNGGAMPGGVANPLSLYAVDTFGGGWRLFNPDTNSVNFGLRISASAPGPAELLEKLESAVTGEGPGTSLADKIRLAEAYLAVPDEQSACMILGGFLNQVRAQRGKKLTEEQADTFTSQAEAIIAAIDCD